MVTKDRVVDLGDENKMVIKSDLTHELIARLFGVHIVIVKDLSIKDIEEGMMSVVKSVSKRNCLMEVSSSEVIFKYNYGNDRQ